MSLVFFYVEGEFVCRNFGDLVDIESIVGIIWGSIEEININIVLVFGICW